MRALLSPLQLLARARRDLSARGDPAHAAKMMRFFKQDEELVLYGLSMPNTRTLARNYLKEVRGAWGVGDATTFASLAMDKPEVETKFVGLFILARYHRDYPKGLLTTIKGWLAAGRLNNWALVDTLSSEVIAPLLEREPDLLPKVTAWATSKNLWLRRAAAVPLTSLVRRGEFLDQAYAVATVLLDDDEDLIHKAAGWVLKEAGRTDAPRLVAYLRRYGARMSRTTLRYAIEKLPAAQRRKLLEETRGREDA